MHITLYCCSLNHLVSLVESLLQFNNWMCHSGSAYTASSLLAGSINFSGMRLPQYKEITYLIHVLFLIKHGYIGLLSQIHS